MEQQTLISVIVPCYKVEAYLPKCVDSILAQTHRNLEIILVDDGSPDASGEIADSYAARDTRVRVIHKQNGGLSSARNAGLDIAAGEFVAFVDSDDWIEPDSCEVMLAAAEKYNVKMVIAGRMDVEGENQIPGLCPEREECISGEETVCRIFHWDHMDSAAWDKLYARSLFREIRYPVGVVNEDVPTTYRLALLAGRTALVPKPVYHYVHRANSITMQPVISDRNFHNIQNSAKVYADICENHPQLKDDARYLYVRALERTLYVLEQSDAATRERFQEQYREIRRELMGHMGFLAVCPSFTLWEKLEDFLLIGGLYTPLRKLLYAIKRRKL